MRTRGPDFEPLGLPLGLGLSASAPPSRQGLRHLSSGALDTIPNPAVASAFVAPPSTTAEAAATFRPCV